MTIQELHKQITATGNTFTQKLTIWGSEYIKINGVSFRLADHDAKYSVDYDVCDYSEILEICKRENILKISTITKDDFIALYISGKAYKNYVIKEEDSKQFGLIFKNGFGMFGDLASGANNLYYNLFIKDTVS